MAHNQNSKNFFFKWLLLGVFVVFAAGLSAQQSHLYGYDYDVPDMPLLRLTIWLVALGLSFLLLPRWIAKSITVLNTASASSSSSKTPSSASHRPPLRFTPRTLLAFIFVIGLIARLILFFSAPVMEDDFQRYLWDGAVTAHGYNPYKVNPSKVFQGENKDPALQTLSAQSGNTLRRVNHKTLRTIYPPVAQGAFALSYVIKPWSLNAWRFIILICEVVTLGFMLALLSIMGRSGLWIALYWWNPLIIKELINSAHMDVLLVPLIIGALYFTLKEKYKTSTLLILLATAVKLWPILLLPILLRPLWPDWRTIALYLGVFGLALIAVMSPIVIAGLDQSSGFVAYAQNWQTNSAFFPAFKALSQWLLQPLSLTDKTVGILSRLLLAGIIGLTAIKLSWQPLRGPRDLIVRCFLLAATLFLLSPAQFPWYALWVLPFSVFFPVTGILMLTALLPLYYLGFYMMVIQKRDLTTNVTVWVMWLPIWGALLWQFRDNIGTLLRSFKAGYNHETK